MDMNSTKRLRHALFDTSAKAKTWFEQRTRSYSASEFKARGGLNDSGRGAVYVYFDGTSRALYVGMTKRKVKARLHDQTSPHKRKKWFKKMASMRFMQLENDMDRLTLEFLLILAYEPAYNEKPRAVRPNELFVARD